MVAQTRALLSTSVRRIWAGNTAICIEMLLRSEDRFSCSLITLFRLLYGLSPFKLTVASHLSHIQGINRPLKSQKVIQKRKAMPWPSARVMLAFGPAPSIAADLFSSNRRHHQSRALQMARERAKKKLIGLRSFSPLCLPTPLSSFHRQLHLIFITSFSLSPRDYVAGAKKKVSAKGLQELSANPRHANSVTPIRHIESWEKRNFSIQDFNSN